MDRLSVLDARRVMHSLKSNLDKEQQQWKPAIFNNNTEEICAKKRDESAKMIVFLGSEFKLLPETCGLAIVLMDKFLTSVKVRVKYLPCVTVTCLYIAAKMLEEDENVPPTADLVRRSQCGCSYAEITRMEMVMLTKFNWTVRLPSAIDFLHMIHVVLLSRYPHLLSGQDCNGPSEVLMKAVRKLIRCLTCHKLMIFRPSTLALALISFEIEQITPGWLRIIAALQRLTNVGSEQLMHCRGVMACLLGQQLLQTTTTTQNNSSRSRVPSISTPRSKKRKVEHTSSMESEENYYDGITRLFGDDAMTTDIGSSSNGHSIGSLVVHRRTSCSMELMHQDHEETMNSPLSGPSLLVS